MGASVAKRMENDAAKPVKELDVSAIQYVLQSVGGSPTSFPRSPDTARGHSAHYH